MIISILRVIAHYEAITDGSVFTKELQQLFTNLNHILSSVFGSQYMMPLLHYKGCFGDFQIVDFFWSGGINNPLNAIEQISYLIFLKRLENNQVAATRRVALKLEEYTTIYENYIQWRQKKRGDNLPVGPTS